MGKVTTKAVFKEYNPQQVLLLPPSLDELIPQNHLVRVVNQVVDQLDLSSVLNQYEGGGASAYHPKMLIKVLLYGYAVKVYTGRRIAQALTQDINFMWLAAYNRPDFRTINLFRSGILRNTIEDLFKELLVFLLKEGYVKGENYFTDGSTFRADANQHKLIWKKNSHRYKSMAETKLQTLFKEIDQLNAQEDQQYGDNHLEEIGNQPVSKQSIAHGIERLNDVIAHSEQKMKQRKAGFLKKRIEEQEQKIEKYERQLELSQHRSGYSKTDPQATAMRMKNEEILPAYNVLSSSENQFITALTVHQNPNDATCFKAHLDSFSITPRAVIADGIFGTEENYELLESKEIENFLKYPLFYRQAKYKSKNPYVKENFQYDAQNDSYICPQGKPLRYIKTDKKKFGKSAYLSTVRRYEAQDCNQCPVRHVCTKTEDKNRRIYINRQLDHFKKEASENLNSDKGIQLRKRRGCEIETCFGDIKHNMNFRRFHLRGLPKVKTEISIVSMAHNLRKIYLHKDKVAA